MYDYALDLYITGLEDLIGTSMLQELNERQVDLTTCSKKKFLKKDGLSRKRRRRQFHKVRKLTRNTPDGTVGSGNTAWSLQEDLACC